MNFDQNVGLVKNGGKPLPQNKPPFVPFQYGPRVCLGINFAYLEIKLVLVTLLQRFKFTLVEKQEITYASSITIFAKNGIKMYVNPLK